MSDFLTTDFQQFLLSTSWKTAVYTACEDLLKYIISNPSPPSSFTTKSYDPVKCSRCSIWCRNSHQLAGHVSRVHKLKHISRTFAESDGTCRICLKHFHNRPRLIHHLRQNSFPCLVQYDANLFTLVPSRVNELDLQDRVAAATAKRSGQSQLKACCPVVLAPGPFRPLIHSCLQSLHSVLLTNAV